MPISTSDIERYIEQNKMSLSASCIELVRILIQEKMETMMSDLKRVIYNKSMRVNESNICKFKRSIPSYKWEYLLQLMEHDDDPHCMKMLSFSKSI